MKNIFYIILLFSIFTQAEIIKCRVTQVYDGDTIGCKKTTNEYLEVELSHIDAPELNQQYGQNAKENLSQMILNKDVEIEIRQNEDFRKIFGIIYYRNVATEQCQKYSKKEEKEKCLIPLNANLNMVLSGYAWSDYFETPDSNYLGAERQAKKFGFGLWADKTPIAPWTYRGESINRLKRR